MRRYSFMLIVVSFLFATDAYPAEKMRIAIIDLQGKRTPSLYELGGFEETKPK